MNIIYGYMCRPTTYRVSFRKIILEQSSRVPKITHILSTSPLPFTSKSPIPVLCCHGYLALAFSSCYQRPHHCYKEGYAFTSLLVPHLLSFSSECTSISYQHHQSTNMLCRTLATLCIDQVSNTMDRCISVQCLVHAMPVVAP